MTETAKKRGPWTVHQTHCKYSHDLIEVYEDRVTRPDGEPGTYCVVKVKPGVCVLAVDEDGTAHMAKQFRYAVGYECVEAVAGAMDEGEEPADAARRELKEEIGIEAERVVEMGRVDPLTSMLEAPSYLFLATGLTFGEEHQEGSEDIKKVSMPLEEAVEKALTGGIEDASSCVLVLRAWHYLKGSANEAPEGR